MFQKIHLLFICTLGVNRSPLAASLFENSPYYEARSAGIYPLAVGKINGNPVDQKLIDWADKIFVMEDGHFDNLKENYNLGSKPVTVLHIPDTYRANVIKEYDDLRELLKDKLKEYLVSKI